MGKAPCCDKSKVKRGTWSPEEDAQLKAYIEMHGTGGNWIALPQKIGLMRCGKSCRLRWLNYLRPNLRHGGFSEEEDQTICSLYISIGSRWSIIAAQLPGRTDNDIKNYWNTKLKKKLLGGWRGSSQHPSRRLKGQEAVNVMNHEMSTAQPLISASSLERMQLYIQLQQQHNQYSSYNPALCPRLHPLGGMIHQAQHYNPMVSAAASIQEPIGNPVIAPFGENMFSVNPCMSNPLDATTVQEDQLDGSFPMYFSSPSTSTAISSDNSNLSPLAAKMKSKQQDLLYCTENVYFKGQECKHDTTDTDYFMGMNGIEESSRYWWPSSNGFGDKSPLDSWILASAAASLLQPDSMFQECGHGYNHLQSSVESSVDV